MTDEKKTGKEKRPGILQKLAENDRGRKAAVAAGFVGILLIFLSGTLQSCGSSPSTASASQPPAEDNAGQYEEKLERELGDLISHISGAGSARVLVTLEQTAEKVYAKDEKQTGKQSEESGGKDSEKSGESAHTVLKSSDGSENALPVTEIQPTVKGVVVVCPGARDPDVRKNITDAVTTALHVTSVRVCVVEGT